MTFLRQERFRRKRSAASDRNQRKHIPQAERADGSWRPRSFPEWLLFLFRQGFFLLFGWLFLCALTVSNSSVFRYRPWILIPLFLAYAGVVFAAAKGAGALTGKLPSVSRLLRERPGACLGILLAVLLGLQAVIVSALSSPVGWDVGTVMDAAKPGGVASHINYFSCYPNNFMLLVIHTGFRRVLAFLGAEDQLWFWIGMVNAVFVNAALVLAFFFSKRAFGLRAAYFSLLFTIPMIGLFPWLVIPYSDTLCMPFLLLPPYLLLCLRDGWRTDSWAKKLALFFLLGFSAYFGYRLKPTTVIILIAAALMIVLHVWAEAGRKKRDGMVSVPSQRKKRRVLPALSLVCSCVLGVGVVYGGLQVFISTRQAELELERAFPMTHFAMMGLVTVQESPEDIRYGGFNHPDTRFTAIQPNGQKAAANIEVIKERLKQMGVGGYLSFLENKARWITGDGAFFWGGEGGFMEYRNEYSDGPLALALKNWVYPNKPGFAVYAYAAQIVWLAALFFMLFPMAFSWRSRDYRDIPLQVLRCAVFGILLFLLFFEGRSRYLINHLPCIGILAGYGLATLRLSASSLGKRKKGAETSGFHNK